MSKQTKITKSDFLACQHDAVLIVCALIQRDLVKNTDMIKHVEAIRDLLVEMLK